MQVLPSVPSFGEQIGRSLGSGLTKGFSEHIIGQQEKKQKLAALDQEDREIEQDTGIKMPRGMIDPEVRKQYFIQQLKGNQQKELQGLKGQQENEKYENELKENDKILRDLESRRGQEPGSLQAYRKNPALAQQITKPSTPKGPLGGLSGTPLSPEESAAFKKVVKDNPTATAEELELAFQEAGIAPGRYEKTIESRRRAEEKPAMFEEEASKLAARSASEYRDRVIREYEAASSSDMRIDKMIKLAESGELSTPLMVKSLDFLGLPLSTLKNPTTENYAKLEADYVRDVTNIFPGAIKNFEIESYLKTIPGLLNSDEGKLLVAKNVKLINEAKKVYYDALKEILKENYGVTPRNLDIAIHERTRDKTEDIRERYVNGVHQALDMQGPKISMVDENGQYYDIPSYELEKAMADGLRISNE